MNVDELVQILNTFDADAMVAVRVDSSLHPILDLWVGGTQSATDSIAVLVVDHTEVLA